MGEVSEDSWQSAPHSGTDCTTAGLSWDTSHPATVCLPSTLWYRGLANRSPGAQGEYSLSSLKEVHAYTLFTCKTFSLWHRSKCIYCPVKSIAFLSTSHCSVCEGMSVRDVLCAAQNVRTCGPCMPTDVKKSTYADHRHVHPFWSIACPEGKTTSLWIQVLHLFPSKIKLSIFLFLDIIVWIKTVFHWSSIALL